MRKLRAQLTYANVMATFAVFIALGGASYAATQLPKNSVGTKQLKKSAVNSAKVKDKSLKAVDFMSGQLPAGPVGKEGPPGPKGAPATTLFAQVKADGTINASSPGVTSTKFTPYTGEFLVNFGQDISHCAVIATQGAVPVFGLPGGNSGRWVGPAIVNLSSTGAAYPNGYPTGNSVQVETFKEGGAAEYSAFHIAVFC
jgi:hypothetical protein